MKYTCEVEINAPIEKVVELWSDESFFHKWQDGFDSRTLLQGEKDVVGAKSRILLRHSHNQMELIETILINDLPRERKGLYEHKHMDNTQSTRFEAIEPNKTRYISEVEYTKFKGFLSKLLGALFPGMFKKQSQKWMDQFKAFVEEAVSIQGAS